ncbi:MAG: hypothetical protein ACN4E2_04420 [Nitrospinota bacterium]
MKILFTLQSSYFDQDKISVINLTKAALKKRHNVDIFLMADGVTHLADEKFLELAKLGAVITVCEHNRIMLQAPLNLPDVKYQSQYELAQLVATADKVIAFIDR